MLYISFVLLLLPLSFAHVCMIWPPQRGGWNPANAEPGDHLCFEAQGPCGKKLPPTKPTTTLYSGTTVYVSFQQNLNHYNPGWPGFLDVAYAKGPTHNTDDEFEVLAQIPDYWSHSQSSQTNFSVPILIPDLPCDWCTLRIRYHPNKPTEPIFHNCGDVRFVNNSNTFSQRLFGFVASSRHVHQNTFCEILPSGKISPITIDIDILKRYMGDNWMDHVTAEQFLSQGLVAPHLDTHSVYFVGDFFFGVSKRKFSVVVISLRSGVRKVGNCGTVENERITVERFNSNFEWYDRNTTTNEQRVFGIF